MMFNNTYNSMNTAYADLFQAVKIRGKSYGPRGKKCIEVRPAIFTIEYPEYGLYTGISRRLNYRFFAIETLAYIAGWNDVRHAELLIDSNKGMRFVLNEDTECFDGAYGKFMDIRSIVNVLQKDPDTRQAVMSIWNNDTLLKFKGSKDTPCTCLLQFYRDNNFNNSLSMNVYMRSNDLNWGTPYDVAAFSAIQIIVAASLQMKLGEYHHISGSLHYYEVGNSDGEKPPVIASLTNEKFINNGFIRIPGCYDSNHYTIDKFIVCANFILEQLYDHRIVKKQPYSTFKLLDGTDDIWETSWLPLITFQHEKSVALPEMKI